MCSVMFPSITRGTLRVRCFINCRACRIKELEETRERAGLARVAVCGVSFGGLIALRYAAARPDQVSALIIVSAPGPSWRPDARVARYVHHPVLLAPQTQSGSQRPAGPKIYQIQLGALDSVADVEASWRKLQAAEPDLLGQALCKHYPLPGMTPRSVIDDGMDRLLRQAPDRAA